MSNDRELLKQALDAMQSVNHATWAWACVEAIASLRAALAEPVLNPAPGYCKHCKQYTIEEPLPAESVREPVAWRSENANPPGGYVIFQQYPQALADLGKPIQPLYTTPPQRKPLTDDQLDDIVVAARRGNLYDLRIAIGEHE